MPRRSKPLLIAPLIPLWGITAFFGVESLHGTRYLSPFVIVMLVLLASLFAYVANGALNAHKLRKGDSR